MTRRSTAAPELRSEELALDLRGARLVLVGDGHERARLAQRADHVGQALRQGRRDALERLVQQPHRAR